MGKENKNTSFENGIKESFNDFSYPPVPAVWSRIEAGLQRRRRLVFFTRLAAAAAFLLLFGISGWMFYRNSTVEITQPALVLKELETVVPEANNPLNVDATPEASSLKSVTEKPTVVVHSSSPKNEITGTSKLIVESDHLLEESDIRIALSEPGTSEDAEPMPADVKAEAESTEIGATEQSLQALKDFDLILQKDDFVADKPKGKGWQLGLGYGTTTGYTESDPSVSYESNSANFNQDYFSNELAAETKRFEDLENTTHTHPITIGITVNKALSAKWGIETGLLFTRLKTTASTNPVNNAYTEYVSEILYIGVPLSVRFSIISGRKFGLYASQGLVLEKGVKTWYSTNNYYSGELTDSQSTSYTADGMQLSSLTSLGVEYKLGDLISIYLQPGFQIFFLNETQPFNIRSSSPYWPSVQTGLRFKL
ncbi:MAG: hypothetical protein IH598_05175 [Bacteroidales bacterium]|nr:hypothetical protein [Bacteroidales bacterium]